MRNTSRNKIKLLTKIIAFYGVASSPFSMASNDTDQVEEIVVLGIKGAISRAVDIKRESNKIVDSISAEDVGKLPDTTIADSLQRVPGVQIRRSAGEGSTINVRGMPQVGVQLNGEQFISAGSITTTQPDFTDIPATLLSGVDVIKSSTADIASGGISGTVNLKTRRPFDLSDGLTAAGSVEASTGSYSSELDPKSSVFVGWNNDDVFGVVATVSASTSNLANYQLGSVNPDWLGLPNESWAWSIGHGSNPQNSYDANHDGDTQDTYVAFQGHSGLNRFTERDRLGASLSTQVALADSFELVADVFYTEMDEYNRSVGFVASNSWREWGWFNPLVTTEVEPGFHTVQKAELEARRVMAYAKTENTFSDSLNANVELKFDNGGPFTGSVRYLSGSANSDRINSYADSYISDGRSQVGATANFGDGLVAVNQRGLAGQPLNFYAGNTGGRNGVPITVDYTGQHPAWDFSKVGTITKENYSLVSLYSENNYRAETDMDVLRADASYEFEWADIKSIDAGIRVSDRDIARNSYDLVAPFTNNQTGQIGYAKWKDPAGKWGTLSNGSYLPFTADTTSTSTAPGLDERGWIIQEDDFGPAKGLPAGGFYFVDPKAMDNTFAFHEAIYPGHIEAPLPTQTFAVNEQTEAFYLQANFEGDTGASGIGYQANLGVRYINTELTTTQHFEGNSFMVPSAAAISGAPPVIGGEIVTVNKYDDWLPSANISFDLADDKKLRFAYSKTMTTQDANDLGLGLKVTRTIDPNDNNRFKAVSGSLLGNPNMAPWRSNNFDISFEWYFTDSSLFSIGAFKMDIESFIETASTQMELPDSDGQYTQGMLPVTLRQNGQGGSIEGLEMGYQQAFDFLPRGWDGFGVALNYTYAPSESANKGYAGELLPIADNSEEQANIVLWYEKDALQARLAYNYRSKRLIGPRDIWGTQFGYWQSPTSYLDASISYDINENITLFAQGTNLTEEYENNYLQWESQMVTQNIYERRLNLGIRARF